MEGKKKVLLIDDDPYLAEAYRLKFEMAGFAMEQAFDGKTGFERAKSTLPDLILLDIIMPLDSGLETLSKLKAEPRTKNIPVLTLTNFGSEENVKKAFELGAADFLMKYRFTPEEVVEKVKKVLVAPHAA
jgi:sigma-B regulation protein RsbU (phosphoserine phosphatase)